MQDRWKILLGCLADLVLDIVELILFAAGFDFVPLRADVDQIDAGGPRLPEARLDGTRIVALICERIGGQTNTNRAGAAFSSWRAIVYASVWPSGSRAATRRDPGQRNESNGRHAGPSH